MSNNVRLNLEYVSDIIGDDYKNWKKGDLVKIKAQCGTGKSYFVRDVLIPYIDTVNKTSIECKPYNFLILSNRINLSRQIKIDVLKKMGKIIPSCDKALDDITTIDNINIISYQKLGELILNDPLFDLENYDIIICDEIHYIYSDSFTGRTKSISDRLFSDNMNAIRIFMSATIQPELEEKIDNISGNKIYKYDSNRDYSYIESYLYHKDNQVINRIINDKSSDKWLYFVDSKKKGESIRQKLEEYGVDCAFVYRGCKKSDAKQLKHIVNSEKFSCKVLISTSILDNGINIKDDSVRHIIANIFDDTNLLQSISRVRIEDFKKAQKINLYVKINNGNEINGKLKRVQNTLKIFDLLIEDEDLFLKKYGYKLDSLPAGVIMGADRRFTHDTITYSYLKIQEKRLSKYKDDASNFCKNQMRTLLHTIPSILDDVEIEADTDNIKKYLASLVGKPLDKNDRGELINMINLTDNRGRQQKTLKTIRGYLEETYGMTIESKVMRLNGSQNTYWLVKK